MTRDHYFFSKVPFNRLFLIYREQQQWAQNVALSWRVARWPDWFPLEILRGLLTVFCTMLFLSFRTLSSQRTLKVAKGFLLMVTSHAFHGQVDGPAEKEIAAQLNRASVELLKSDMGDLTGDGFLEYAAVVDTDIILDGQK